MWSLFTNPVTFVELDFAAERTVESQVRLVRETTARQALSIKVSLRPRPLLNVIAHKPLSVGFV